MRHIIPIVVGETRINSLTLGALLYLYKCQTCPNGVLFKHLRSLLSVFDINS